MRYRIMLVLFPLILAGCALKGMPLEKVSLLTYEPKPSDETVLRLVDPIIRVGLNDPDSLKLVKIGFSRKCYRSTPGAIINRDPADSYGGYYYYITYRATNGYGGYVEGRSSFLYLHGMIKKESDYGGKDRFLNSDEDNSITDYGTVF